jgi:hypothetical protein
MQLIFIKIQAKNKEKKLGNTDRQDDLFLLFHKQYEPVKCQNPKQQNLLELRKTLEPQVSSRKRKMFRIFFPKPQRRIFCTDNLRIYTGCI